MLKFDNLTGDASLDWIQAAASAILSAELTIAGRPFPARAETARDANLQQPTELVHGYFEKRRGALRFYMEIEDAGRHKLLNEASASGGLLDALTSLARRAAPHAHDFSSNNREAVDAWGHGDFERAVALDPDFGIAWLSWIQTLVARGDSAHAQEIAARALMRGANLHSELELVQIQVLEAGLRLDGSVHIAALERLATLAPFEAPPLRGLAEDALKARRFADAARAYNALTRIDPQDLAAMNMLGYAQALAGNLGEARASFERYSKQPGQAVNALDSLGEAMFLNGRFPDAEQAFLECNQKDANFENGVALWKAAHARWLAGDLSGADELMSRYMQSRVRAHDPSIAWRQATWLYETGRKDEAIALLNRTPDSPVSKQQLAVWNNPDRAIPQDLAQLRQIYEKADPVNDGLPRTLLARALYDAGRKDEARKLLQLWPLPPRGNSPAESLMYPEFLQLRKELLPRDAN